MTATVTKISSNKIQVFRDNNNCVFKTTENIIHLNIITF